MSSTRSSLTALGATGLLVWSACSFLPPLTAEQILARSVKAHGGDRLTSWRTLVLRGHVQMLDGIVYNAAFTIQAKAPRRLRVEQDMTADRGRIFTEYFLDGDVAWSRRNLIPGRATPAQLVGWLRQCSGVGYFARHAAKVERMADTEVEWRWKATPDAKDYQALEKIQAYVIGGTVDGGPITVAIDKKEFHLIREVAGDVTRLFHDFREIGGRVIPTKVLEVTKGRQGEVLLPYTYESLILDQPIEDWVFDEDRPKTAEPIRQ